MLQSSTTRVQRRTPGDWATSECDHKVFQSQASPPMNCSTDSATAKCKSPTLPSTDATDPSPRYSAEA
eukprot:8617144-Alexandrium_andersonii.AAC.1